MSDLPELLKKITPHRLTQREIARMAVHRIVNPFTGQFTGERYVDPIITSGLEQMGIDPEPYVRSLLEVDAADSEHP